MTTYRELFANREFRAIFAGNAAGVAGQTMQMLALSALVYASTGSPLLAALALFGGLFPQAHRRDDAAVAGRPRCPRAASSPAGPRRRPPWPRCSRPACSRSGRCSRCSWSFGAVDALTGGIRAAVIVDIVPGGFVLGRSVMNVSVGAMQIVGFATGGTIVAALGPGRALAVAAVLVALAAVVMWRGLRPRPAHGIGRAGIRATWQGNRALLGSPVVRPLLLGAWLPNGLIVGAEAMFVPFAGGAAAALFVAAAVGMLAGDVIVGRWVSAERAGATGQRDARPARRPVPALLPDPERLGRRGRGGDRLVRLQRARSGSSSGSSTRARVGRAARRSGWTTAVG